MKIKLALVIGLISMNLVGTACGAAPTDANAPSFTMTQTTPELEAAEERVRQADAQLSVARKQLKAAQQLLKAAEADLRAAKADKEALAIKTQAQSLADEAGMTPSTAPPVSNTPKTIATKPPKVEKKPEVTTYPVMTDAPATSPAVAPSQPTQSQAAEAAELKPVHNVDFNAMPLQGDESSAPAPTVQLR